MARTPIKQRKPVGRTADSTYSGSLAPYTRHFPDAMTDPKAQRVRETVDALNQGINQRARKRRFLKQPNTI